MPGSYKHGKREIVDFVRNLKHDNMLDIGCGEGTYAKLFPESNWTGVEIWQPYVDEYKLHDLYSDLHVMDARKWRHDGKRWDVAVAGDVLEHMTAEEAKALLEKLRSCTDWVIISIPFDMAQGEWGGNPYERHVKDDWSHEEVKQIFGEPEWCHIEYPIGVYAFKGKPKEPLKICVYAISKNEAHFVERFCKSAKEADLILIADTGSTDGLPEEARKHGAVVHDISISPWRFDLARNAALALIPRDFDVCISLDIDEVLQPGWREEIERVWVKGETTRLRYMFDWGCGIKFYYEKIHAKHGYMWHHPCHEYPVADGRIEEVWAQTDMLLAVHMPDPTKSRGQYLDLLELSVKEDPDCPRNAFYYARELSFHSRWQDAINACNSYLKLPRATWENERCYAYRVIGRSWTELGDNQQAEKAYQMAASEAPNTREPWCELAALMYRQGRWEECFAYSMRALRIKDRDLVYTCDPAVWGAQPHDYASISAWNLGLKDIALEQGMLAVSLEPNDARLRANLDWYSGRAGSPVVPNIVHMMYFMGPKSRDFSFINYLAVKAAHDVQKPTEIRFYYNQEPENNQYWESIKAYVTLYKIEAPESYEGSPLYGFPQYQADLVRLQALYEHGGIYLDTDAILTKPLTEFMTGHHAVMAGDANAESPSFSAATILAEPKSEFIRIWLSRFSGALLEKSASTWAWHSVCLPVEIQKEHPRLITVLEMKKFLPFDWYDTRIFSEDGGSILPELDESYVVHMWDSLWYEKTQHIDEECLKEAKIPFAKLFSCHVGGFNSEPNSIKLANPQLRE